jgi:phage terminase small subunit
MSKRTTIGELVPVGAESPLPAWAMPLTPRKLAFVQEYLVDFNGRLAAKRAGLSESEAGCANVARGLLHDPPVRAALAAAMADGAEERRQLRQRIIEELSVLAFYDIGDMVTVRENTVTIRDTDDLTDDQRRAVRRYKQTTGKVESIEVEMHDKVRALELLASVNGDKARPGDPSAKAQFSGPIQINITPEEARCVGTVPPEDMPEVNPRDGP